MGKTCLNKIYAEYFKILLKRVKKKKWREEGRKEKKLNICTDAK
jgi:hypothetical protein